MNRQELLNKELSNFYAINKQINKFLNGSEIAFLPENAQRAVMDYLQLICKCEEQAAELLDRLDFNPANTIDSIVSEITDNLSNIIAEKIADPIKAMGYRMSWNRLVSYQLANVENLKFMANDDSDFRTLLECGEELRAIKERVLA